MRRRSFTAAAFAACAARGAPAKDASDEFFAAKKVYRLRVDIAPAELERLKNDNRHYVRARFAEEGGAAFVPIGVKMKGAAGSFRPLDQRPALTLNAGSFGGKKPFHDLQKFHLNNSEQDRTRMHEMLGGAAFRAAGVPTPRAAHARVWLNGRDLGLYVVKEGFDRRFLKRWFRDPAGNLYDSGFLQDVDAPLSMEEGRDAGERKDLQALADACKLPDPKQRWAKMAERLDLDEFLKVMAIERLLNHWDGYAQQANNYRLYFDPARGGKALVLPHGMDQLFGDPGYGLHFFAAPLVSRAVQQSDAWRARYREILRREAVPFLKPEGFLKHIDELAPRVLAAVAEYDKKDAKEVEAEIKALKERVKQRAEHVKRTLDEPDPPLQAFDAAGFAVLRDWQAVPEGEEPKVEEAVPPGEKAKALMVQAGPKGNCAGSWRRRVLLGPGQYRMEARVRTEKVVELEAGPGSAAGFRRLDADRAERVDGTHDWKALAFAFEVREDRREFEFAAELRAKSGRAWFDPGAFKLTRKPLK